MAETIELTAKLAITVCCLAMAFVVVRMAWFLGSETHENLLDRRAKREAERLKASRDIKAIRAQDAATRQAEQLKLMKTYQDAIGGKITNVQ